MKPKYLNAECRYHGMRFDVLNVDVELPKGKVSRELVDHPGAVVILPIFDETNIILIRNYRFAVGKTLLELPAGTLEPGEEPVECALRELEEETGYRANHLKHLFNFYPTPGFCNEILHAYVAKDLHFVGQKLGESEQITIEMCSFEGALEAIFQNKIVDAKTISTLLYYHTFHSRL